MSILFRSLFFLTLTLAAIYTSGCMGEQGSSQLQKKTGININESLIKIAGKDSEIRSFIASNPESSPEITVLHPEDITALSQKYPAIYGNLPNKMLYRIEYKSDRGVLAIVDLENEEVLKSFRTAGVTLG